MAENGEKSRGAGAPAPSAGPPAGAGADPLIGRTVGNFKLVRLLGAGGMGAVYLAEHRTIGSRVAVKFLHPHLAHDRTIVERFFAEARAANLAGHEHIVSVVDLDLLPPDRYYLIMEYLEGHALSAIVHGPVAPSRAVPILAQTCEGLQAAHAAGVIHRDLKFENIFLVQRKGVRDYVKILDFGIAKLLDAAPGVTSAGLLVGTPEYMAPEQWVPGKVDGRADMYALGIISYALLTGRMPFYAKDSAGYYAAHREQKPEPLRRWVPSIPPALEEAILRALEKDPDDRHKDAAAFGAALLASLAPAASPRPRPAAEEAPPAPDDAPARAQVEAVEATVHAEGQQSGRARVAEVTRGGMLLATPAPFPQLRSRVRLEISEGERPLVLDAEVVRHITEEQAKEWGITPGFGVQFGKLSPESAESLARVRARLAEAAAKAPEPAVPAGPDGAAKKDSGGDSEGGPQAAAAAPEDRELEERLRFWEARAATEPYLLLGLATEAECSQAPQKAQGLLEELEKLQGRTQGEAHRDVVMRAQAAVQSAADLLGNPARRALYDAERGSFRGVARCLAAGLSAAELESLRRTFLAGHPDNEASARRLAASATKLEQAGALAQAEIDLESALALDPLCLELHRRYWSLRRRSH